MKLGEAILEKEELERDLELLKSRIARDIEQARPTSHLLEEIQRKAILLRDINIAVAWSEQQNSVAGLPLGAYRIRVEHLINLAQSLEHINRERADFFWAAAHKENKFIESVSWVVDLQIPRSEKDKKEEI